MDIWEKMYLKAKEEYRPQEVTPFLYAHHVVCALESENGEIYTGFCVESCCGVMDLCAERVAALNMYVNSGQTVIKRLIVSGFGSVRWRAAVFWHSAFSTRTASTCSLLKSSPSLREVIGLVRPAVR